MTVRKFYFTIYALFVLHIQNYAQFSDQRESCLFVSYSDSDSAFVGINEDNQDFRSKIWFVPASANRFGRVFWGFDRAVYAYQGGVNEKGLLVDINTCGFTGWLDDPLKPNLDNNLDIIDSIMSSFSTIKEITQFFQTNDYDFSGQMLVFSDSTGKSLILEFVNGKLQFLSKEKGFQVCTNSIQSSCDIPKKFPCARWKIAYNILQSNSVPSINLIRRILSATCAQSYYCYTSYSVICDIKKMKIFLYNFHNYEENVVFDIISELAKGSSGFLFKDLFVYEPYSMLTQKNAAIQWGDIPLMEIIDEVGISEGLKQYKSLKKRNQKFNQYVFQDWSLRNAGMHYLNQNKFDVAVELFKLNLKEYPGMDAAYSDLAFAYLKSNQKKSALKYYKKALSKAPGNPDLLKMINQLKKAID